MPGSGRNGRVRPRDPPLARDRSDAPAGRVSPAPPNPTAAYVGPSRSPSPGGLAHSRDRIAGSSGNPFRANLPRRCGGAHRRLIRSRPRENHRLPASRPHPKNEEQHGHAGRWNAPCPRLAHRARPSRATSAGLSRNRPRPPLPEQLGPTAIMTVTLSSEGPQAPPAHQSFCSLELARSLPALVARPSTSSTSAS